MNNKEILETIYHAIESDDNGIDVEDEQEKQRKEYQSERDRLPLSHWRAL